MSDFITVEVLGRPTTTNQASTSQTSQRAQTRPSCGRQRNRNQRRCLRGLRGSGTGGNAAVILIILAERVVERVNQDPIFKGRYNRQPAKLLKPIKVGPSTGRTGAEEIQLNVEPRAVHQGRSKVQGGD